MVTGSRSTTSHSAARPVNDAESQPVDIRSLDSPSGDVNVSVATNVSSEADAIPAGGTVNLTVEIENTGSEDITDLYVGLTAIKGAKTVQVAYDRMDLTAGDSRVLTFDWQTLQWHGDDDDAWTVEAFARGETATAPAWLQEIDGAPPSDPGFGSNPIGIDIDDIKIT